MTHFIEIEFFSKVENILKEKLQMDWFDLGFESLHEEAVWSFKGYIHSLIANDSMLKQWLERFNDSICFITTEHLNVRAGVRGVNIALNAGDMNASKVFDLFNELINESDAKMRRLTKERYFEVEQNKNIQKLTKFIMYLNETHDQLSIDDYLQLRKNSAKTEELRELIEYLKNSYNKPRQTEEDMKQIFSKEKQVQNVAEQIEKDEINKILNGSIFKFENS